MTKRSMGILLGLFASIVVERTAAAQYSFTNATLRPISNTNVCLGVAGGDNMSAGTRLITWNCDSSKNQHWTTGAGYSWYTIRNQQTNIPSGACISLPNQAFTPSTVPIVWNCSANTTDQYWSLNYVSTNSQGHACYTIQNDLANFWRMSETLYTWNPAQSNGVVTLQSVTQPITNQTWCVY